MNKSLRYISISHKAASVSQREEYHIPEKEKRGMVALICDTFPDIAGLLLLVTCNRMEIYFESATTSSNTLRDFLIQRNATDHGNASKQLFNHANITEDTVRHLLEVSSGLSSSVLGDVEIVHQIKKAYQFSIAYKLQGSLLERAMQTVFKSHKRVSNETHFRDGTTSVAYKSLKVVSNAYDRASAKTKKILFVGAGDIVEKLFKYNSKFSFSNIYISNRTEKKAMDLAKKHQCKLYDWNKVLANEFHGFDVIISAVGNYHHLIQNVDVSPQKLLLIDLALPSNIDKALSRNEHILFHDLDSISAELDDAREKRLAAIGKVDKIIDEELSAYIEWCQEAPLRALLAEYKLKVNKEVLNYFEARKKACDLPTVQTITNVIIRKSLKRSEVSMPKAEMEAIITEHASILQKTNS